MPIPLPIETERLLLRAFDPSADVEDIARVYRDPDVMRLVPGGPLADLGAVRAMLGRYASEQAERGFTFWAVVEQSTERVIGDAGFGVFEGTGELEVGYTLVRDRWGLGYATEAATACLEAGFAHLDPPRIIAVIDEENAPSMRVAERIGMALAERIDAFGRPHVVYEALR